MSARAQTARGYRPRPVPRGARRRGGSRVRWDKVGRVALVLVLVAILASYVKPALNFWDAWQDSKAEHASVAQLREENVALKQRIASLAGLAAAEREARKLGMVASGEASYVIRGLNH